MLAFTTTTATTFAAGLLLSSFFLFLSPSVRADSPQVALENKFDLAERAPIAAGLAHGGGDGSAASSSRRRRSHNRLVQRQRQAASPMLRKDQTPASPALGERSAASILSGSGQATFYYDIDGGGTCGPVNGWSSYAETNGYAMCEPDSGFKTLAERGSDMVVAIASNTMSGNLAKYCGKELIATFNGKSMGGFIVWDGCAACNSEGGVDFSSTAFAEVVGSNNCAVGRVNGLTWTVTDNQIWEYPSGNPVSGSSSGSGSGSGSPSTSANSTTKEVSPSSTNKQSWSSSSNWVSPSVSVSLSLGGGSRAKKGNGGSKLVDIVTNVGNSGSSSSSSTSDLGPTATASPSPSSGSSNGSGSGSDSSFSSSSTSASTGSACDSTPGQWQCAGNTLQQCILTSDGSSWEWSTRVKCAVAPINCDTPNPVCPQPVRA